MLGFRRLEFIGGWACGRSLHCFALLQNTRSILLTSSLRLLTQVLAQEVRFKKLPESAFRENVPGVPLWIPFLDLVTGLP